MSCIHNISYLLQNDERNMHNQSLFTSKNSPKQNICWWILMWEDNRGWNFSLEQVLLWIMDRSDDLKSKCLHDGCFLQTQSLSLCRCYLMDLSHLDYQWIVVMFLSAVWTLILTHPLTPEDSLVSKWCTVLPNFFKSAVKKKQTPLHLAWPEGEYIFWKFLEQKYLRWRNTHNQTNSPVGPGPQHVQWSLWSPWLHWVPPFPGTAFDWTLVGSHSCPAQTQNIKLRLVPRLLLCSPACNCQTYASSGSIS